MPSVKRLARLMLLAGVLAGCARLTNGPQNLAIEVGKQAPDIQGRDADGRALQLSHYAGKVVLLDFWRTG